MTSLPITKLEAAHILDEYRRVCWDGATLDLQALQHVLAGAARDDMASRVDGVTEEHARRALDLHQDRWHRPPTARQLHQALDDALSSPDEIRKTIDNTRQILANAKARRAHDHAQLRAQSEARQHRSAS